MAESALAGEVQAFPDILRGWGIAFDQTGGIPPMEWFNALANRTDQAIRYFMQRGLPEWSATEDYPQGAYVQYAGNAYLSKRANTNKQPGAAGSTNDWGRWSVTRDEFDAGTVGRLLGPPKIITSSGPFNESPGTKAILVALVGGGGGSPGVAATGSGQWGGSGGGGGGAFAIGYYTAGFSGAMVTIGTGGSAGTGGAGAGKGGTTSFGSLLSVEGGLPGSSSVLSTSVTAALMTGGLGGSSITGSGIVYKATGASGGRCFLLPNSQLGGDGGGSGNGGEGGPGLGNSSTTSNAGVSPGSGAGGLTSQVQAAKAGGAGAPGQAMVWELS
ncbi:hypothetical protein ACQKIE_10055 [Luteibacter sp. NPDC031894]|uniref:hypothetical protein n=1 Tax=Luteibacter sp. NPDC031894 TaxID=3390572 RepID=UPI003D054BC4